MQRLHVSLVVVVALLSLAQATPALELDLLTGELDGRPFNELTLDEITDSLGRPSAVQSPKELYGLKIGPELMFHDKGIEFSFEHPGSDPDRHCREVTVYLAPVADEDEGDDFAVFVGSIAQGITGDWKADAALELLEPQGAVDMFDQESYDSLARVTAAMIEAGVADVSEEPECGLCLIIFENEVFAAELAYEYNTRFLESVKLVYLWGPSTVRGGLKLPPLSGEPEQEPRSVRGDEIPGGFSVSNVSFSSDVGGLVNVMGEIRNDSPSAYTTALFTLSAYDDNGNLLGVGHILLGYIGSGQTKSFNTLFMADYDALDHYKVDFESGF